MFAIVLDGHLTKSALACVRSLGEKGVAVSCGSFRKTAPAFYSHFVSRQFIYASPKTHPEQFIEDVIREAKTLSEKTGEKPVIFSFSDATSLLLARSHERLQECAVMVVPSLESIETAGDKGATYALAQLLSIPTIQLFGEEELDEVTYPAIVKNRHSIVWKDGGSTSGSAQFVFSKEELKATYANTEEETGEAPLVQEFIKGDEYGVEMVCDTGEPLATFAHKRIRSLSPRGGAAVVKETAASSSEVTLMRTYAHALVKELKWHGPVMVEFKLNAKDGRVLLMEINGRFWGSLPLAIEAGIDFPSMVYELAQGKIPKHEASPRQIRTRHFLGDCKWLLGVLFARDPLRPILYPSRLRAVWDFKKEFFISKGDVFRWKDPLPAVFEYIDILYRWK